MSKTYFLAPTRDTPPSGPIFLGSIIKSPRSPELSINGRRSPLLSALQVDVTQLPGSTRELTRGGNGKTGVWVEFLGGMGIGAALGGSWDNVEQSTYKFDELVTETISPSLAQVQAVFQEPDVQRALRDSRFRDNLYMITGIKIARGADIAVSRIRSRGGHLSFGIDMTPFGVPIRIGPDMEISRGVGQSLGERHTEDFVFAYRLREIRYRRKVVEDQREYRQGDLMGAGPRRTDETAGLGDEREGIDGKRGKESKTWDEVDARAELIGLEKGDVDGDAWYADSKTAVDEDGEAVNCVWLEDEEDD